MAGWIKMPLGTEVGLDLSDIVLDGDPAPPRKRGNTPRIFGPSRCGQTAGWIKMPLGTKVCLGPGRIMLDGDPAPAKRVTVPLLWSNGRPSHLPVLLNTCTFADSKNIIRESITKSICGMYWYLFYSVLPTIFQYPFLHSIVITTAILFISIADNLAFNLFIWLCGSS